jgi:hypothetical protein
MGMGNPNLEEYATKKVETAAVETTVETVEATEAAADDTTADTSAKAE